MKVAFGDSSYFIISDNHYYYGNLPQLLYNKVTRTSVDIEFVALGRNDQYYISFENGKSEWVVDSDFTRSIHRNKSNVEFVVLGEEHQWFILHEDGSWEACNLPKDLWRVIQKERSKGRTISRMAFDNYRYWVLYTDGHYFWSNSCEDGIQSVLDDDGAVDVAFDYDGGYFVDTGDYICYLHNTAEDLIHSLGDNDSDSDQSYDEYPDDYTSDTSDYEQVYLSPTEIRFSQSSISQKFSDPSYGTIHDLLRNLRYGQIQPEDIDQISVVYHDGDYWTKNNRRLWAFQKAGIDSIPVQVIDMTQDMYSRINKIAPYGYRIAVRQ